MTASTVNLRLTPEALVTDSRRTAPHRPRRAVENDDYAAFVRRIVAAHGRRIAAGDVEGLAVLAGLASDVDTALTEAVTGLRAAGWSWADVGARLGMSRQAAQQRFGTR